MLSWAGTLLYPPGAPGGDRRGFPSGQSSQELCKAHHTQVWILCSSPSSRNCYRGRGSPKTRQAKKKPNKQGNARNDTRDGAQQK